MRKYLPVWTLVPWIIFSVILRSCDSESHDSHWFDEYPLTIGEYLKENSEEYSKFFRLLEESGLLITLCGYNPYGEGYTLFLPNNDAVDQFIQINRDYDDLEEILLDTALTNALTRYHTINKQIHTNEFPYGALNDTTLTGERLTIGFYTEGDHPLYKVNNVAPIVQSNLEMTNGYIHVISEVLQQSEISGYDWLQQQDHYSILAAAMELSGIRDRLWWDNYTILAEHDSIYQRNGISTVEDLISRIATTGIPISDRSNSFFQFTAYHILRGDYYLNDLYLGEEDYRTLGDERVVIDVGMDIRINPGVDTFGMEISESGDTAVIDYIRLIWEECNRISQTGPLHSISDLLVSEPFPEQD